MPVATTARDDQGRFLTGNSGGGRRKGSRNKLTERFLDTIADDFAEHGADAIARVVGSLIPRELIMKREEAPAIDPANVSHEELVEYVEERRRQQSIECVLKSVG